MSAINILKAIERKSNKNGSAAYILTVTTRGGQVFTEFDHEPAPTGLAGVLVLSKNDREVYVPHEAIDTIEPHWL